VVTVQQPAACCFDRSSNLSRVRRLTHQQALGVRWRKDGGRARTYFLLPLILPRRLTGK
jgi:hypothetical protein